MSKFDTRMESGIEVSLRYYDFARQELLQRLQIRHNVLIVYLAATGALSGVAVTDFGDNFFLLSPLVPLLGLAAALVYMQQDGAMDLLSVHCKTLAKWIEDQWDGDLPDSYDQFLWSAASPQGFVPALFASQLRTARLIIAFPQLLGAVIGAAIAAWREQSEGRRIVRLEIVQDLPWAIPVLLLLVAGGVIAITLVFLSRSPTEEDLLGRSTTR